jgi:hypothetical protein
MRNLVLVALSSVMGISGCDDDTVVITGTALADLSVQPAPADLTPPLKGCNGLLDCYITCEKSKDVPSCLNDCDATGSSMGLELLSAYGYCIDMNCFQISDADAGTPCTKATVMSTECQSCYQQILNSGGACYDAAVACVNNLP